MLCAAAFAVTELGVSKVTLDLISAPQDNMCIEMKVQLKGNLFINIYIYIFLSSRMINFNSSYYVFKKARN